MARCLSTFAEAALGLPRPSPAAGLAGMESHCNAEGQLQALDRTAPNPAYRCLKKSLKLGRGHLWRGEKYVCYCGEAVEPTLAGRRAGG